MFDLATRYKAIVHYNHFLRSIRKVAAIYKVSKSCLHKWLKQESPSSTRTRRKRDVKKQVYDCISSALTDNPFMTMQLLASKVAGDCQLTRSRRTILRYVKSMRWSRKSAQRLVNHKHDNTKVLDFCKMYTAAAAADGNIICIDEAGFYVGDHARKGWAPKGTRLKVRSGRSLRRTKFTLLMAVSAQKIVHYEILDHNCKKPDFVKFVSEIPAPRGSTLVMDNIKFHHSRETKAAMVTKGFTPLYIPPYSPKMNAIENIFGAVKPKYRQSCPSTFATGFDYKYAFVTTLSAFDEHGFHRFFVHTLGIVRGTMLGIEADPDYVFHGYD